MKCSLCNGERKIIYKGIIRNGGLGNYTEDDVFIYKCSDCGAIWHENKFADLDYYYESEKYRQSLEGSTAEKRFYELHDRETLDKFRYTGTDIFRQKTVADIGCGAGAFLDFLAGVVEDVVAIEPSAVYRDIMKKKGFSVYPYAEDALKEYGNRVDVITSFDVIEHVENPQKFLKEIYELLAQDGRAIIGTPTDAPVMRKLLGEIYEKNLLFSTQHLWIFSEKSLCMMAEKQGFNKMEFKYFQRYGIGNMLGWVKDKKPGTEVKGDEFISAALDGVWRGSLCDQGVSDYIVMYLEK